MKEITDLFTNVYLLAAVISWFSAQTVKIFLTIIRNGKLDLKLYGSTGGMPSAHTATVAGLAFSVGKHMGFSTAAFAIALILAVVVMTDAVHLRQEVGRHAKALEKIADGKFDTLSGHTASEVAAGLVVGALIGLLI